MPSFPAIEVVAAPAGPAVGTRVAIGSALRLGRAAGLELTVRSPSVSPLHCGVFFEFDRVWLRDLGSTRGTWFRGARVHEEELLHGDCFELAPGCVFRAWLREPTPEPADEAMEAALRGAAPEDPRWAVYVDWLGDHGAALQQLDAVAGELARAELVVGHRDGLVRSAAVRALDGVGDWPLLARLELLAALPALRFLEALEVHWGSFHGRELEQVHDLEALVRVARRFSWLRQLTLAPSRYAGPLPDAPFEVLVRPPPPLEVELISGRWRLHDDAGLWRAESTAGIPFQLNGRDRQRAWLREGDVLGFGGQTRVVPPAR